MDNNQTNQQTTPEEVPAGSQQQAGNISTASPNAGDIANALIAALDARQQRTERSVIHSFAQQNNMSVEELTQLVNDHMAELVAAIPDEVQARINERLQVADNRLIAAEVKAIGAQLHLVDTDAAFALMDKSGIAVDENGNVTGVQEALTALTEAKPWLVEQATHAGTGSAGNFPRGNNTENADYAARLAEARQNGNNTLATAIISEAAAKGIALR